MGHTESLTSWGCLVLRSLSLITKNFLLHIHTHTHIYQHKTTFAHFAHWVVALLVILISTGVLVLVVDNYIYAYQII